MNKILIDTDALFGIFYRLDPHHENALKIFENILHENHTLAITNLVIYESITLVSYRISQHEAIRWTQELSKTSFEKIFITEDLETKAMRLFLSQKKNKTSFVDCANIVAMETFKIPKIFSFDKFYQSKLLL